MQNISVTSTQDGDFNIKIEGISENDKNHVFDFLSTDFINKLKITNRDGNLYNITIEKLSIKDLENISNLIPLDKEKPVPFIISYFGLVLDVELRK